MAIKFCNTFGVYMLAADAKVVTLTKIPISPYLYEANRQKAILYLERYQSAISPELSQYHGAAGWPANQVSDAAIVLFPGDILFFAQYYSPHGNYEGKTIWYKTIIE